MNMLIKKPLLGCIADDFTGATDLANNLVKSGMRTVQTIGVPDDQDVQIDADAIVVALKSRTIPVADAVSQSLEALLWLQSLGVEQLYFKYCSTFDSTPAGNIGPVIDALLKALNSNFTVACPAFPEAARTIYKGHLFVGDQLLSDSGMKNHPLTPMTDANLVRVLQSQTSRKVGLVDYSTIAKGSQAITKKFIDLQADGIEIAVLDVLSNEDLQPIGQALSGMPLVTAGSGVAIGLPQNWGLAPSIDSPAISGFDQGQGFQAILSGSCSLATNAQVESFLKDGLPGFCIDPFELEKGADVLGQAVAWAQPLLGQKPILFYATAEPESVKRVQESLGTDHAGQLVEKALAMIALELVKLGVKQLVVAGGETSGAVIKALKIDHMTIGPQIAPGVPWTSAAVEGDLIHIALKSGNFGGTDFFTDAFKKLND
jgi:3-dehydrotetronate 4-kinase